MERNAHSRVTVELVLSICALIVKARVVAGTRLAVTRRVRATRRPLLPAPRLGPILPDSGGDPDKGETR